MTEALLWIAIVLCLSQSGIFSGLNLALLGFSRLRLEIEADSGNEDARTILALRTDANFLLTTVLWGNVSVNVLLTLITDSVMAGASAFIFSTFAITFFGEILPQAWFSRNALRIGARFVPLVRMYQFILWPVARPSAWVLDRWLGPEGITWFREKDLHALLRRHMASSESDVDHAEALGAINLLELDDLPAGLEGEQVDPDSIIALPIRIDLPIIPDFVPTPDDPFVRRLLATNRKWVVLTSLDDHPLLVLDVDAFARQMLCKQKPKIDAYAFCHRPLVVLDGDTPLGEVIRRFEVHGEGPDDDVIDRDVILVWGTARRVITGADLLGRILRGVVRKRGPLADAPTA